MNIYDIKGLAFEFQLHNLSGVVDGHITTIVCIKNPQRWVFRKHGSFAGLCSMQREAGKYQVPAEEERAFLQPKIDRALSNAQYYERGTPPQKRNLIFRETSLQYATA